MLSFLRLIRDIIKDEDLINKATKHREYHKKIHIDFDDGILWFSTLELLENENVSFSMDIEIREKLFLGLYKNSEFDKTYYWNTIPNVDSFADEFPGKLTILNVNDLFELDQSIDEVEFVLIHGKGILDSSLGITKEDISIITEEITEWRKGVENVKN